MIMYKNLYQIQKINTFFDVFLVRVNLWHKFNPIDILLDLFTNYIHVFVNDSENVTVMRFPLEIAKK